VGKIMNNIKELMNRLIDLRIEKGLSQKDISEVIGINQTAVSKLEQGLHDPKLSVLLKYFDILELDINNILE
jgi:transcriptional regulator with XRE-family HTH domain